MPICPACQTAVPDGGTEPLDRTLAQLSSDETVRVIQTLWQAKDCDTERDGQDGATLVVAKCPQADELVQIGLNGTFSDSEADRLESIRQERGFDTAYYVTLNAEVDDTATTETYEHIITAGREKIRRLVEEGDLAERVRAEVEKANHYRTTDGEQSDETRDLTKEADETTEDGEDTDSSDAYGVSHSLTRIVTYLCLQLIVAVIALGILSTALSTNDNLLEATIAILFCGVVMLGLHRKVGYESGVALRIDEEGIYVADWERTIPWEQITGVYREEYTQRVEGITHTHHYLTVEVTEYDDELQDSAVNTVLSGVEKAMMGNDADAYRENMNQFGADFEEIATAVERYGGVPTGEK